jgi:hypothetical protein
MSLLFYLSLGTPPSSGDSTLEHLLFFRLNELYHFTCSHTPWFLFFEIVAQRPQAQTVGLVTLWKILKSLGMPLSLAFCILAHQINSSLHHVFFPQYASQLKVQCNGPLYLQLELLKLWAYISISFFKCLLSQIFCYTERKLVNGAWHLTDAGR